jgi:site-specific recombinase XerD
MAVQTGLRVSELVSLRVGDVVLDTGAHVRCLGKGRKERATPLTSQTTAVLRSWLNERRGSSTDPLFTATQGRALSRYGVAAIVDRHVTSAATFCPSLMSKTVSPHVLRHTAAGLPPVSRTHGYAASRSRCA